jgi:transcriptional regulator with XRE-family HTH domain
VLELAHPREEAREASPLGTARLQRQLSVEDAADRAGLTPDQVRWLEDGLLYRFPSPDRAVLAALVLADTLGIDGREARRLAGLPVPPRRSLRARLLGLVAVLVAVAAGVAAVVLAGRDEPGPSRADRIAAAEAQLPPRWKVSIVVLNGSGDVNHTRNVASRVGAMGYLIERVSRADRFDYRQTNVYYPPGGEALGARLARELGVAAKPLPGGSNPRRLVVVTGPAKGPGDE